MILFVTILLTLFLVTSASLAPASAGWQWDTGNALGFGAFALLMCLFFDTGRSGNHRHHQQLSYWFLGLLCAHIVWLLVIDSTIWYDLRLPGPAYMWSGVVATLAAVAVTVMALPKRRRVWHQRYANFVGSHQWLSITILGLCLWHLLGSGFYTDKVGAVFLTVTTGGITLLLLARRKTTFLKPTMHAAPTHTLLGLATFVACFVVYRYLVYL